MKKYVNEDLIKKKGLSSDYFKLENFYKYLFQKYILSKIDLELYENELFSSGLGIGICKRPVVHELDEYFNLKYLYLLNNFFIEKLNEEDINLMRAGLDGKKKISELFSLIERTYKDIIKNNFYNGKYVDTVYNICYGIMLPSNFGRNNAVVLKIYYSDTSNLDGNDYIDNINKQMEFIEIIVGKIKKCFLEEFRINCDILIEKV